MKQFVRRSFKRRQIVCFLAVALLPLLTTSIFLTHIVKTKVESDYEDSSKRATDDDLNDDGVVDSSDLIMKKNELLKEIYGNLYGREDITVGYMPQNQACPQNQKRPPAVRGDSSTYRFQDS